MALLVEASTPARVEKPTSSARVEGRRAPTRAEGTLVFARARALLLALQEGALEAAALRQRGLVEEGLLRPRVERVVGRPEGGHFL